MAVPDKESSQLLRTKSLAAIELDSPSEPELTITGISCDSRTVSHGGLFAALPGSNFHGAKFVKKAIENGAAVILTDQEGYSIVSNIMDLSHIRVVVVENPRAALAKAAAQWFDQAPEICVAVTGTNGKTSIVSICQQIWQRLGHAAASVGTLGVDGACSTRLDHTTPDPITLHHCLAQLAAERVTHVSIEASSHGLQQFRLDGVQLSAAAFTNLSHDHLDYHETFRNYFKAKAGLFARVLSASGIAVICTESEAGKKMVEVALKRGLEIITVGRENSDLILLGQQFSHDGQRIRYSWKNKIFETKLYLIGGFQAWNVLTAAGLVIASGENPESVFETLAFVKSIRGRLQLAARRRNGAAVYVDYAHTPDGLRASLSSLREHYTGRLVAIIGAGGDRDRLKRPIMGKMGSQYADNVIVTNDNPRSEDPALIRAEIMDGCSNAIEIADRAEAIVRGADMLDPGDVLLIAGKGHENGQEIAGHILPFDDFEQASIAVRALDGKST